uniref:Uncharacterized protein n=1 Tax=Arundo donax TaxID=35708 RepID=A0A0A9B4X4_ARUDO
MRGKSEIVVKIRFSYIPLVWYIIDLMDNVKISHIS